MRLQEADALGAVDTLLEVLAARSAEVAEAVNNALARHVAPSSAWLTAEHQRREHEILRTHHVERVLGLAAAGKPTSDDDLRFHESLGALFARHEVPLPVLTAAFDVAATAITGEAWRIAPAAHFTEMAQFTSSAARMLCQARQAATHAYLRTAMTESGPQPVRRLVAEALIAGQPALAASQAAGAELAPSYLVMACAIADPAQSSALQRPAISQAAENIPGALYCDDRSRLVVLLPAGSSQPQAEASAAATELAGRLCALAGQQVYAGQAYQPGLARIPAALDEARNALCLAMAIPDGDHRPYRMEDLLVELAISRQPDIRQRLTGLLSPLEAGADLRHTLEVLLACNLDRERAASELCIHRRTLRYRLDRIRELSGIDPDSVPGLQLLRAALTAARLANSELRDPDRMTLSEELETGFPVQGW